MEIAGADAAKEGPDQDLVRVLDDGLGPIIFVFDERVGPGETQFSAYDRSQFKVAHNSLHPVHL